MTANGKPELPAHLQHISAHRTIYLLNDVSEATGRLKATHYVCCLTGGPRPQWGVFNIDGKLIFIYDGKTAIERDYNRKSWRRKEAMWTLQGNVRDPADFDQRVVELKKQVRGKR
jgi:hypothetical protein